MDELRGNVAAEKTRLYVEPTLFKRESMSICKDVKQ